MTFDEQLKYGQIGEGVISKWLQTLGWLVLPVYEKEIITGKGPRVWTAERVMVAPDLAIFKGGDVRWVEAKRKTAFTWHRHTKSWQTGIDRHHYEEYKALQTCLPRVPLWLLFLHESETPSMIDQNFGCCPDTCPTGLFGGKIAGLGDHARFDGNHGNHGMVYWKEDHLLLLAGLDEVRSS